MNTARRRADEHGPAIRGPFAPGQFERCEATDRTVHVDIHDIHDVQTRLPREVPRRYPTCSGFGSVSEGRSVFARRSGSRSDAARPSTVPQFEHRQLAAGGVGGERGEPVAVDVVEPEWRPGGGVVRGER